MKFKTGIGQDSHRFLAPDTSKPCVIGGVIFHDLPGFHANSDGDVVFHSICNALTSLTGTLILGGLADELCINNGITDSAVYLQEGLKTLGDLKISHVALAIEGKRPKLHEHLEEMRESVAEIMGLEIDQIGITATSGEGLTDVGCGDGLSCTAILSAFTE